MLSLEDRITPTTSFVGIGTNEQVELFGEKRASVPPNAVGAIGPDYFVENLNSSFSIYTRAGNLVSTIKGNDFFDLPAPNSFSNTELKHTVFDTRILFDRNSGRWFALAARAGSFQGGDFVSDNNDLILAVSKTSDPTAPNGWYRYNLDVGETSGTSDYPTLGVDSNGVYIGLSILKLGANVKSKLIAIPLAAATGGTLTAGQVYQCDVSSSAPPVPGRPRISADMFFAPQAAYNYNANATTAYFVSSDPTVGTSKLKYATVTWSNGQPTFSAGLGEINDPTPVADPNVLPGSVGGFGGAPALGTVATQIKGNQFTNPFIEISDRRLLQAFIRDGYLWTTRNVAVNATGTASGATPDRSGAEWFKVNLAAPATPADHGIVYDPSAAKMFFYYPSLAVNGQGDMHMGFSGSSTGTYVGAFGYNRPAGGPVSGPTLVKAGQAAFNLYDTNNRTRWGDYSFSSLDPLDDMTVWTVQEYAAATTQKTDKLGGSFGTFITTFDNAPPVLNPTNIIVKQGRTGFTFTLTGTGFYDFVSPVANYAAQTHHLTVTVGGTGINNVAVQFISPTQASLTFDVTSSATIGPHLFSLTNPDGQTTGGTITVTTNEAPVLGGIEPPPALAYSENGPALAITNTLTLTDADNSATGFTPLAHATVKFTQGFQPAPPGQAGQDVLEFIPSAATGTIQGNYDADNGILTLTATAPEAVATWLTALKAVKYRNTGDNPGNATRTVSFQVDDGEPLNHSSNTVTRNIAVTPANDPPVLQNVESAPLSYAIGASGVVVSPSVIAADLDDANLAGATVTISSGYEAGKDVLGFVAQPGINGVYANGVLTFTGNATKGVYTAILRSVTFANATGVSGTSRVLTFQLNDGHAANNLSPPATRSINIAAPPAPIAGTVWLDLDNNGVRAANETGVVSGAVVELFDAATNASLGLIVTAANGTYGFTPPTVGQSVYIQVRPPAGMVYTAAGANNAVAGNDGKTAPFVVTTGATITKDAGLTDSDHAFGFALRAGGAGGDSGAAVATDSDGNVIIAGKITGTVDLDSGPAAFNLAANGTNAFVAKYTSAGALIWARLFQSDNNATDQKATGVAIGFGSQDVDTIYVTGYFAGATNFNFGGIGGPQTLTATGTDAFVVKFDKAGNFVYARKQGGAGTDTSFGIAVDGSKRAYITGQVGNGAGFVTRLQADGTPDATFQVQTGGAGAAAGRGIALDGSGNVYVAGDFVNTVNFNPGVNGGDLNSAGANDVFIWKLTSAGAFGFAKSIGDTGADAATAIRTDASANLYVAGSFSLPVAPGPVDFDPDPANSFNLTSAGATDAFVLKLTSAGAFTFAKRMGGAGSDSATGLALSPDGGLVVVTGTFTGTANFNPAGAAFNLTAAGGAADNDAFAARLANTGGDVTAQRWGGNLADAGLAVTVDGNGSIFTAGEFASNPADFNPLVAAPHTAFNLSSAGGTDLFLSKIASTNAVTVVFTVPSTLTEGQSLTVTASASAPGTFSWDINGDGVFGDATGANATLSWATLHNTLGISPFGVTYPVRVRVTAGGATTTSAPLRFTTVDPPVFVDLSANPGAVVAGTLYTLTLPATFVEAANGADVFTGYTIHWGDGTPDTTVNGNPHGATATHTYNTPFTNNLIVVDLLEGAHTDFAVGARLVAVGQDAPTLSSLTGNAVVDEGAPYTLTFGTVSGATSAIIGVFVNWGDGSSTFFSGNPSGQTVAHVYADGGAGAAFDRHVSVDLFEALTFHADFATTDVHVADVAPTISVFTASPINQGDLDYAFLFPPVDPGADTVSQFTIDWGDGSATETYNFDPSFFFTFHPYNVAGLFTIHVSLTDEDGAHPDAGTATVIVGAVSPHIALTQSVDGGATNTTSPVSLDQGLVYTLTLGAITQAGSNVTIPASEYVVHWGDGTSDTFTTDGPKSHVYIPTGVFSPTVDITTAAGTFENVGDSLTVFVTFAPPVPTLTGNARVNEGSIYSLTIGAIDADLAAADGYDTYTVNWNDGTSDTYTINTAGMTVTHVYVDGLNIDPNSTTATNTITLDINSNFYGTLFDMIEKPLIVDNVKPTVTINTGPAVVDEGTPVTFTATFTDPGATFDDDYTYVWHVATTNAQTDIADLPGTVTTYSAAGTPVADLSFTPGDNGTYTISLIVTDKDGDPSVAAVRTLTVLNVKPTATVTSGPTLVNEGTTVTFGGSFTDPGTTYDIPYTFTWHVSTTSTQVIGNQTGTVTTYSATGTTVPTFTFLADDGPYTYTVSLVVRDKDGADSIAATRTLTVLNVPPTATFTGPAGVVVKHQPATFGFSKQFDPSKADTAAGFRYFFDFNNDGDFTDFGDVNGIASPTDTFYFKRQGTFTVRARIMDKDNGFTQYTTTVTVIDTDLISVGTDSGTPTVVKTYAADTGALKFQFSPFPGFLGGVRTAQADFNGDWYPEIVVAAGPGGGPHVKILDGKTLAVLGSFMVYDPSFSGGIYVAAADVNGDGVADIVTGAGAGGGPHVKVIDGTKLNQISSKGVIQDSALITQFMAYAPTFAGGVRVAATRTIDVTGAGKAIVIVGPGAGGGPHVRAFDGSNFGQILSFMAFDSTYTGGVFVAAGDLDGDDRPDVIVSQGQGNTAHVRTFSGADGHLMGGVWAYPTDPNSFNPYPNPDGVRVMAIDRDADGLEDVVVGAGTLYPGKVRSFKGTTLQQINEFIPYDPLFLGGIFVG